MPLRRPALWLILLAGALSYAQPDINGYLKGFTYYNPHSRSYDRLGTRLQTRFSGGWGTRVEYFAAVNLELDLSAGHTDSSRVTTNQRFRRAPGFDWYPVEFFLTLHLEQADIRFGQQYLFWGTTDWINPTDVINPWDYENITSEPEDYRLPVTALAVDWYGRDFSLQGVWIPGFTPAGRSFPPGTVVHYPELTPANSQYGFRLQSYKGSTDWSLSYYHGFDALPSLHIATDFSATPPDIRFDAYYHPFQMVGFDFARTWNEWAVKGETAYLITDDPKGTNLFIRNPSWQTVLGVDYNYSADLVVNIQYVNEIRFKYNRQEEIDRIEAAGLGGYLTARDRITHSVSGRISWEPLPFVTSQVITVYNFADGDVFLLGFLAWELADATHLTAGGVFFAGPGSSPFGRLNQADQWFIELKRSF
jgi:hypothetical protein